MPKKVHPAVKRTVELDDRLYTWDGSQWFDASFLVPPTSIVSKLNALIDDALDEEDARLSDTKALVARARKARVAGQYDRAERIARLVLAREPAHEAMLSVLCAVLRKKGLPEQAVQETEPFKDSHNTSLLTSRAAALCDLERWEEAKKTIGRALARRSSEEAFLVVKRIKKVRPDLYD
jgi:predicted Zn-dependent protease